MTVDLTVTGRAVNVVVYFDASYAVQATTMVRSLLDNAASDCVVDLYVLGVDLTAGAMARAAASWPPDRLTVHWITVDLNPYGRLFRGSHYRPVAYSRLLIDRLLPDNVSRVISLDCDGLVLDDIAALWRQAPIRGCVSAATDLTVLRLGNDPSSFTQQLNDCADAPYFNSGVMVVDLARWRYLGITTRCLHLARRYPGQAAYADQSLLNAVLRGQWERLTQRWNCNAFTIAESCFPSFRDRFVTTAEVNDARRRPGFVHFVGRTKPWKTSYHPHAELYRQYQSRTRWALPNTAAGATTGWRLRRWYRRTMFPIDRYRRVQHQAVIHHVPRRRMGDVIHLMVTMVVDRNPSRYLDDGSTSTAERSATVPQVAVSMPAGSFDALPEEFVAHLGDARGAVRVRTAGGQRRLPRGPATVQKVSQLLRRRLRAATPLEPVDAVYLWVDKAAPGTAARLSAALARGRPDFPEAAAERRFRDHDELRYSLRSLARFAPWVRRVHVVTDGDPPPWLALGDRCAHVTHDQIFSEPSGVPSFNSYAIEWQLHRVPGLTRRFLYLNDDFFLGRPVAHDRYLQAGGRQVVYLDQGAVARNRHAGDLVARAHAHTAEVTEARLGAGVVVGYFSHTPQLLDCELLRTIEALWPEEYGRTSRSTFRGPDDLVLGVLYPAAAIAGLSGSAPASPQVLRYGSPEYSFVQFKQDPFDSLSDLAYVEQMRPRFFCINDDLGSGALSDRLGVFLRETLERMYPVPSRYELRTE